MRRETLNRLEAVERRRGDDDGFPDSICITVITAAGEPMPVLGWRECMTQDDPIEVWREPDESDDDLHRRAELAMKARPGRHPKSVPVMVAITE